MNITIYLDDADIQHADRVREAVRQLPAHDADYTDSTITVAYDSYTAVDGAGELLGAKLLALVQTVLSEARGEVEDEP